MDRVLVSYRIPNEAYEHQCQTLQFDMPDEAIMRFSPDDLKKRLEDYDALLVIGTKVDDDLMAAGKKLRVIGNMGVGYDKIDVQAASRRKIWVVNTPFSVTQPTAELTIGCLLYTSFVCSASGQAAIVMPIMAPLSDIVGLSRQVAVLAYQYGDGLSNTIFPVSSSLVASLAIAGVPFQKWRCV